MSKASKVVKVSRHEIHKKFQLNGFNLKRSALKYVYLYLLIIYLFSDAITMMESEYLNGYPPYQSLDEFIKEISKILMLKCKTDSFIIDSNTAQSAVDHIKQMKLGQPYDQSLVVKNVFCETENKSGKHLHHYMTLFKNVGKHPVFQREFKLNQIDQLITSDVSLDCIVLGFLRKDHSKLAANLILEDATGQVPISFTSDTQYRDKLIVENSFVLVEGNYQTEEDNLYVNSIGLPPISSSNSEQNEPIQHEGRMIVILHDVNLDDESTVRKLKILLTGYNSNDPVPDCFIFIGDFLFDKNTNQEDFKGNCFKI